MRLRSCIPRLFCLFLAICSISSILNAQALSIDQAITKIENGLMPNYSIKGESDEKFNLVERMKFYQVPGLSMAFIQNGKIAWTKEYGLANTKTQQPVHKETLFQAGSISKPLAALAALKLVQVGKLDLDTDVNQYLKTWKVPENKYTQQEKITLRRLLTHTAGLTVHGFPGYDYQQTIPSTIAVLNGEGNTGIIHPDTIPGSIWRYSGGGYTVMQQVIEEVTGEPFETYLQQEVLDPMGMSRSSYQQPLPATFSSSASAAFNGKGEMVKGLWNNYPEKAAAGLWTTPTDLAKYCIEIQQVLQGKTGKVLDKSMVEQMLTKDKNAWGLGPTLQLQGDSLLFGHGGKNRGFSNNMVAFAHLGQGVIIMTNGDRGGALINEITRSISNYYGWNLFQSKVIETVKLDQATKEKFCGTYQFLLPDTDDYFLAVSKGKDGYLYIEDFVRETKAKIVPTGPSTFLNIENGMNLVFHQKADGTMDKIIANGRYHLAYLTQKPRARDLGIPFIGQPGPLNAITDVKGVEVGHTTIISGSGKNIAGKGPVRTGVTAIFPRGKKFNPVYANWYSLNGNGEMTGTTWVTESGFLETPIMITNTNSVGVVRDAVLKWYVDTDWYSGEDWWYTYPVVAETYDGFLNDIYGFHVKEKHVLEAIKNAKTGPVTEGNVGGGTGMMCLGFKGGIGTASRIIKINDTNYTLGVLVQSNFGSKKNLTIAGVPVGKELRDTLNSEFHAPPNSRRQEGDGSIIVIVATDAPLLPHQLKRIVHRVPLGIGVVGGFGSNGSGDIFLAFSTANEQAFNRDATVSVTSLPNDSMTPLFEATGHAVEEAIINAMAAAETMEGIHGNKAYALPHDLVQQVLRKYNRLKE